MVSINEWIENGSKTLKLGAEVGLEVLDTDIKERIFIEDMTEITLDQYRGEEVVKVFDFDINGCRIEVVRIDDIYSMFIEATNDEFLEEYVDGLKSIITIITKENTFTIEINELVYNEIGELEFTFLRNKFNEYFNSL